MATPIFPNERMLDVYKALELGGLVDLDQLDEEIQTEGVNTGVRDYDFYHAAPGSPSGDEYIIARPRTGKGDQFAMHTDQSDSWQKNGQWDPAQQDMIDPSAPIPGVNAPIQGQPQPGVPSQLGPPPGMGMNAPYVPMNPNRMTGSPQMAVDPAVSQQIGTGERGSKLFDDALDKMLADADK